MIKTATWDSHLTTTKGRELSKASQKENYSFLSTGTPTYWPTDENKIPNLLDFLVTSGIFSTHTDIQSSYDLTSDHSPITAILRTSVIVRKPKPRLHNSKTNWDTYRQILETK